MYEKELLKLIESIIVPSGYKTVHIGNTLEVSSSQFLEKKQVERLANKIVEQYHQPNLAEMPSDLPIFSVKRSYYKNCAWCGKITTKDRWVEKNETNDKRNTRPLCYK
jgi:hypothetical protein